MLHIEDFGLAPRGEVGPWVTAGKNGLDGDVPVNTHGGLLSETYLQGLNHVIEAVQQLRPGGVVDDLCDGPHTFDRSVCRQVRSPEIALVCGESGASALLLRKA
jgi:acetyl-CoA acetyltransferase